MRTFKLKTKHYRDIVQLLIDAGAADLSLKVTFPSDVYCSKEDFKRMEKAVGKAFRKEYPGLRSNKLKSSIAMHMLNYSPNETLAEGIRPGYVLVDDTSIKSQIESTEKA